MSTRLYQFQAPSEYKHIQETDAPVRLQIQLLRSGSTPLDADSLTSESNWTFDHVTKPWILKTHLANAVKVDDIRRFLVLQHVEKLDLPFIAMCTREDCPSLFKDPDQLEDYPPDQDKSELNWHKILWAIQDLDLEWLMLQKRKRELKDRCQKFFDESRRPHDKMRQSLYKKIFQSSMKFLESANSEREVEDVETKFIFHFNQDVLPLELHNVAEEDIWKQMWEACQYNVKSVYSVCSKAGLWRVAYNFGPSSEELGLQLSREMNINELEEPGEMPLDIAARFTSNIFRTREHVLKGARLLTAVEISLEPIIRQYMRRKYFDALGLRARLSRKTMWPKLGKRLSKFKDEDLFRIQKAKDNGTLDFTIKLLDDDVEDLHDDDDTNNSNDLTL
ncbi:transcription elongation factor SPT6 homolog isoform X3 [Rosa chinensis]|nr:transcription elongation factor SPT6 homolog isoform X3 [Rosa chinensis]XP_040364240.1 transcription elongation factor SPT6 homolog isoform X3 [Rosa chinensis]XP_040364241.1 transcription elongation factor SPT6 homolog isoform X3 [Rosa chinensis]